MPHIFPLSNRSGQKRQYAHKFPISTQIKTFLQFITVKQKTILFIILLFVGLIFQFPPPLSAASEKELLSKAKKAIANSDYRTGAGLIQKVIRENPDNMEAIRLLEYAFTIKTEREKLEKDLKKYIKEKNLISAQIQYKRLKKSAPNHAKLDDYSDEIKELEKAEKFSIERLNLSKQEKENREKWLEQAKRAMKNKEYVRAIGFYQKILESAPGDLVAQAGIKDAQKGLEERQRKAQIGSLIASGKRYFQDEKWLDSKKEFEQVLLLDKKNLESIEWLEKIDEALKREREKQNVAVQADNFYRQGIAFINQKKYDDAVDSFEKAMLIVPNYRDSNDQIRKTLELKRKLKLQQERQRADSIAKLIKDGLVAYYSEDYQTAIGYLGEALKIDPQNIQAKETLERARDAQRLKSEEEIGADSPFYPVVETFANKAKNLFQRGKYREAKEEWNEILLLFPKNRMAIQESLRCDSKIDPNLFRQAAKKIIAEGRKLLVSKNYRFARKRFQMVKEIDPNYPGIDSLLAQTRQGEQKTRQAKLPRNVLNRLYNQGLAFYRQKNYAEAKNYMQRVVANDPLNFEAAAALARIQKLLSIDGGQVATANRQTGLSDAQKSEVRRLYLQGLTQYSNNNYRQAIRSWRRVLAIDPRNREARANILRVEKLLKS